MENYYSIKISPEVILSDKTVVQYSGESVPVYSSMTQLLSGGTNRTSLLTGLTIPILLTESTNDLGYYSVFDGAILQKEVVNNFIFSADNWTVNVYNTSEQINNYLQLSNYTINWGDGTPLQVATSFFPIPITHTYPVNPFQESYTITLTQINPWGITAIRKVLSLPFTGVTIDNPEGEAFFTPMIGSWSSTPISYDFIFSGDAINLVSAQTSNNYVSPLPFTVSGVSTSQINELQLYGPNKFVPYQIVKKNGVDWGQIISVNSVYTAYTIQGTVYYDYSDGTTIFFQQSSGLTSEMLVQSAITKNETFLNVISSPEVYSDIFIERGKNTAYERIQRLGEVDNLGDLINYGYGFFNVSEE